MNISVSIVIYNEKFEVLDRLLSLFDEKYKIYIFDNSPKNKLEDLCKKYSNINYIYNNGENIGFGAGHNKLFREFAIESEVHLIVNPDIYFDTKELKNFLQWFEHSDAVMALPKILNTDGTTQKVVRKIPTPLDLMKRRIGLEQGELKVPEKSVTEIPFAHGCFMALKMNVFKKLGGFDERFFMYMEDVDIWRRAKKYGKTVINTNYSIYHEYRKGSSKNLKLFWYHIISVLKYFWKYK
ncbi:glycosyltransferase family 2 protein [Sulfurimonas sp. SWIR-19]|uniref:glycosyltransferase family 2 protein n=1 Tax=Sulfurimonas sp. SWIR-19 TaxID=2878390 RepID=UPI001CF42D80|nr:glycosyltransferase family 2 protein [Sulfurimonas sp. SWIR-19]UCN00608.1 glycosyltransferase family 2 protein [Sulfurimonas sp. SWIR-19]